MKLGIDMGGMSIKMGLVNEENEIIGRITIPTDLTVPYQMLVERMADAVQQMLENAGMTLEQCEGIGIGSPGTIDAKRGVILYSNNFGWENVPIVEELKKHLDVGIEIANDADAAALGRHFRKDLPTGAVHEVRQPDRAFQHADASGGDGAGWPATHA